MINNGYFSSELERMRLEMLPEWFPETKKGPPDGEPFSQQPTDLKMVPKARLELAQAYAH